MNDLPAAQGQFSRNHHTGEASADPFTTPKNKFHIENKAQTSSI
jgi:hypothetical protein